MEKLRNLLMERLGWGGDLATDAANYIIDSLKRLQTTQEIAEGAAATATMRPSEAVGIRHMTLTLSQDMAFAYLRLNTGDSALIYFDAEDSWRPTRIETPIRVGKNVEHAAKMLRAQH